MEYTSTLQPMVPLPESFSLEDIPHPLLEGLNPPQAEAVERTEGPLLILAGAGSGKTRVLTRRIAYMLSQRLARRHEILAVTFTNKAAKEMQHRIQELCGPGRFPDLGTFHSVCARWLRVHADRIGLAKEFAIYATDEQMICMREVVKEWNRDEKQFKPRSLLSGVSRFKNLLLTPDDAEKLAKNRYEQDLVEAYRRYQKKLQQNQAVDFDDLLLRTVELFRKDPEILQQFQQRIRYILIDEYQDVNPVQYELVRLLAGERRNLCVVGDDDQSIYAFRGADVSIMLRFEQDFHDAKVIKLEQNYRSSKQILDASNAVVAHNLGRKHKQLWTDKPGGEKLQYFMGGDGRDEGRFITKSIRNEIAKGRSPKDFVLLYRTNSQSRLLEEAMINAGLPYKIIGGLRFFERKEIKDVLAHLAVMLNPSDSVSLKRIINVPARGVGDVTWQKLMSGAAEAGATPFEALLTPERWGISGKVGLAIRSLGEWMFELASSIAVLPTPVVTPQNAPSLLEPSNEPAAEVQLLEGVTPLVLAILEKSGYKKMLRDENTVESTARLENLDELINVTTEFDSRSEEATLANFLAEVSLLSDQDTYSEEKESITLMTLHAAKGLEFPVVFLAGLEEETFPHARSLDDPDQMEEERRLCYVGMTRAMSRLYLSSVQTRELNGMRMGKMPSRFLKEVPAELIERVGWEPAAPKPAARPSYDSDERPSYGSGRPNTGWKGFGQTAGGGQAPVKQYTGAAAMQRVQPKAQPRPQPGCAFLAEDQVLHVSFGRGVVQLVEGDIVTVEFEGKGVKRLKADFLKRVPPTASLQGQSMSSSSTISVGDRLDHPRWGEGVVKSCDASTASVLFPGLTVTLSIAEAGRLKAH